MDGEASTGLTTRHAEWLEARALDAEACAIRGWRSQGPAIAIPYIVGGREIYAKLRDPRDKTRTRCHPAGVEQIHFWNEDCLLDPPEPSDVLVITEGEPDAEAVLEVGFQFVVSMPSGAANTAEGCRSKVERVLTRAAADGKGTLRPEIAAFKRVVILADGDHDGLLLRAALVEALGDEYCLLPTYPDGCKDANEVKQQLGSAALRAMIEAAVPVRSDGFVDFVTAVKTRKRLPTYEVGIPFLKDHLKLTRPEFLVIGGEGGVGKTTIYQSLVYSFIWHNPWARASILHMEGDPWIPYVRAKRFWSRMTGEDPMPDTQAEAACHAWIRDHLAFISPPQDETPTFEWLLWAMEMQALAHGRNVFVIDPWNEISHRRPKDQTHTEYIGEAIIRLKRLADRHRLVLIVCHHIAKRKDYSVPPTKMDLSDSQHWGNKADHVILAWRPWTDRFETRIEVAKSKDYDSMGRPGHAWVKLDSQRFELMPIEDPIKAEKERAAAEREAEKERKRGGGGRANGHSMSDADAELFGHMQ